MLRLVLPALCFVFLLSVPFNTAAQIVNEAPPGERSVQVQSEVRLPNTQFRWDGELLPDSDEIRAKGAETTLLISGESELAFTGIAVGWRVEGERPSPDQFSLRIWSSSDSQMPEDPVATQGYISPEESPSGYYWAMLYVTPDGSGHNYFEIEIDLPPGRAMSDLRVTAANASDETSPSIEKSQLYESEIGEMPDIIAREGWWGNLPPGQLEPSYNPARIDITHAAVHHTVTANEPADPPQVVRQIWDWHVNDNGWQDIGYNFLIDHEGNIYQGRYNPWLDETDVRGAHAGNANGRSTGIGLLGQFEPGENPTVGDPASVALDALVKVISWRFTQNEIDPLGSSPILTNFSDGSRDLPHIMGHRDVTATACPGQNLYTLLPDIRTQTETGDPIDNGDDGDDDEEEVTRGPFELQPNYPNPFTTETTIPFTLDAARDVRIVLYTVRGDRVKEIFNGRLQPGEHEVTFSPDGISSGVYFYELITFDFRQMRQMVYIR
ncbi:MAG: N-acetylmuramoyl-L-alanine amidase [Balneolaceae bacterium]|nr:N-acetylmuramoyl-L-alanine amidase [Balneolaceae bacterium]MCH8548846.1 N-acetylmuramoyl-L-alanine amidase [Balneolaceae bacterium]